MKTTGIKQVTANKGVKTSDLRGIKNTWVCPNCKYKYNRPIDTVFKWSNTYKTCDKCQEDINIINPSPEL